MSLRIAYLVNQYPKVSHSFIRREIHALERQGVEILRVALRGWDEALVDLEDKREQGLTRYVLKDGVAALVIAVFRTLMSSPMRFVSALALAIRMGRRAERPLLYHLAYLAEACRVLPWLKTYRAVHVHAHFGTNSAEIAMLVRTLGGPSYSFTAHGTEVSDSPGLLGLDEKVRRSAFAVAVSSYGRSVLYRWSDHAYWPKIKLVHCGLESSFFDAHVAQVATEPRLVCVGRLCTEKGQLLLIEAAYGLLRKGIRFELVLAGDGEMRDEIEALVQMRGLSERVRITGWINSNQVKREILPARGLVLPSFAEGLPVVLMEAMALRRPVIATFVGGIPELVTPGENGWLVPAGSVEALADAMERLLGMPMDQLQRMGEAARESAVAQHSVDTEAAKLAALFRKSIAEHALT